MKRGKGRYQWLVLNLSLGLLLVLSGCTFLLTTTFDPTSAHFYNPKTNTADSFQVKNLNQSVSTFYHENQIELLVGLKDAKGHPGTAVNLTLSVIFKYAHFRVEVNLTENLGLSMTTNESGIAQMVFIYNQYTWPKSGYSTNGVLKISSPQLNITQGTSKDLTFNYYQKEISRNSSTDGGIAAITKIENMNVIEEAMALGGEGNLYLTWQEHYFHILQAVLNQSTLNQYAEIRYYPSISVSYLAWAQPVEEMNLTYPSIKKEWNTYIKNKYALDGISDDNIGYGWLITGPLTEVNVTTGWLVMQQLIFSGYRDATNAVIDYVYQVIS
jgi:hypothetical protein